MNLGGLHSEDNNFSKMEKKQFIWHKDLGAYLCESRMCTETCKNLGAFTFMRHSIRSWNWKGPYVRQALLLIGFLLYVNVASHDRYVSFIITLDGSAQGCSVEIQYSLFSSFGAFLFLPLECA